MTYADLKRRITYAITSLPTEGSYDVVITGFIPGDEMVNFNIKVEGCYTEDVLRATLDSTLEELLDLRYDYTEGTIEDTLLYDGGTFNESN